MEKIEVGKYAEILPLLNKIREEEKEKEQYIKNKISNSCLKKGCYSKKQAVTIKNQLHKKGNVVREYHCPHCNFWHITHKIKPKTRKKKNHKKQEK